MKKLIIAAACSAMALGAFAQGTIGFNNAVTTEIYLGQYTAGVLTGSAAVTSASLGSQNGSATPSSTGVLDVGLFWSTSAFSTVASGINLGGIVQISTTAGRILGSAAYEPTGVNAGDADWYQVFCWDSSYGNTLAGLQACIAAGGYFGASSAGAANTTYGAVGASLQITANTPPASGNPVFNTSGNSFGKTILLAQQTPEPATIALGGLGAAALLLFRRRK